MFVPCGIAPLAGCRERVRTYQTQVALTKMQVVHRDDQGKPRTLDVEIDYTDCPGEQLETLQGDEAFAKCMGRYKLGEHLAATVVWGPTDLGHYDSEVVKIGECERRRDQ